MPTSPNNNMKKWIVHYDAGTAGTDAYESVIAETQKQAEDYYYENAMNWFDQFDRPEDETDEEEDEARSEISCYVEEYNSEYHDGLLSGGQKEWDWREA